MNVIGKIWLNIGILGQNKIGLVCGFCGHFIGIGLVSFVIFLKMTSLALTQHVPPRPDNARDISSLGGTQPAVRRTALQRRSGQLKRSLRQAELGELRDSLTELGEL